ncbi:MAG: hypothetical protein HWD58_00050 [Bacteroidota bacterium]|nr:MAG: hypothetical protein HWD58_00050 [Bacteroidota bacterium]
MRIFVLFLYFFQQLVAGVVLPVLPSGTIHPEGTFSITNQKQHPSLVQYIDRESEADEEDEQVDNPLSCLIRQWMCCQNKRTFR